MDWELGNWGTEELELVEGGAVRPGLSTKHNWKISHRKLVGRLIAEGAGKEARDLEFLSVNPNNTVDFV